RGVRVQPPPVSLGLGHSVIALPFAILVILPRLRSLDPAMNEAALDLGASSFAALRYITLPLLTPALASSVIICFVTSFDEFAIASFLAPSGQPTYPIFLYASARTPPLRRVALAGGAISRGGHVGLVGGGEGGGGGAGRGGGGATVAGAGGRGARGGRAAEPIFATAEPS